MQDSSVAQESRVVEICAVSNEKSVILSGGEPWRVFEPKDLPEPESKDLARLEKT